MGGGASGNKNNNNGKNAYQAVFSPITYVFGDKIGGWLDPLGNPTGHAAQNTVNYFGGYHSTDTTMFGGYGTENLNNWFRKNVNGIFDKHQGKYYKEWDEYYKKQELINQDQWETLNKKSAVGVGTTPADSGKPSDQFMEGYIPGAHNTSSTAPFLGPEFALGNTIEKDPFSGSTTPPLRGNNSPLPGDRSNRPSSSNDTFLGDVLNGD